MILKVNVVGKNYFKCYAAYTACHLYFIVIFTLMRSKEKQDKTIRAMHISLKKIQHVDKLCRVNSLTFISNVIIANY